MSRPKNYAWSPYWPIGLLALLFFGLWLATLWVIPTTTAAWLGIERCGDRMEATPPAPGKTTPGQECLAPVDALAAYGTMGDMFGTVNALFSGLALAGVVLTLYWQARERRRDNKPFLIPSLDEQEDGTGGVVISKPGKASAVIELPVVFEFSITNSSPAAALNVHVQAGIVETSFKKGEALPLPIGPDGTSSLKLAGKIAGNDANTLVGNLRTGATLTLDVEVTYGNLDAVRWRTAVQYRLSLDEHARERDGILLKAAIDDGQPESESPATGAWTGATKIALVLTPVQGSWSFGEVEA